MNLGKKAASAKVKTQRKNNSGNLKPSRDKSSTRKSPDTPVKASRKNPPENPKLEKLIELVNQVPDGLPDLQYLRKFAILDEKEPPPVDSLGYWKLLDPLVFEQVEKLPPTLQQLLPPRLDSRDEDDQIRWALSGKRSQFYAAYEYLTLGREALTVIVDNKRKWVGPFRGLEIWAHRVEIQVGKKKEFRLRVEGHPLLDAIHDIDPDRLRRCPVCRKFFWAGHGNKKRCSDACGNAERNRKYRQKYKNDCEQDRLQKKGKAESQGD